MFRHWRLFTTLLDISMCVDRFFLYRLFNCYDGKCSFKLYKWIHMWVLDLLCIHLLSNKSDSLVCIKPCIWFWFLVLTIFIEAYFALKSIFHKALNLFSPIVKSRSNPFLEPTSTRNKGKVSCLVKQRGHLMGLEPTISTLQVRRALPTVPAAHTTQDAHHLLEMRM